MIELTAETQLKALLAADTGFGDITSHLLDEKSGHAYIVGKEDCILSGMEYAKYLFESRGLSVELLFKDGEHIRKGEKIISISGLYENIFEVERTALNVLTRMSGIATETQRLVEKVRRSASTCRVAATRKTVLQFFDKEAVSTGGGDSHRFRLDDMVLLKDSHVKVLGIEEAIRKAKTLSFSKKVEIEVSSREDAVTAATCGADIIMLDNMDCDVAKETVKAVKKINSAIIIEASGGITEENIERYAQAGVDIISVGYITHSVKAVNMSLEVGV